MKPRPLAVRPEELPAIRLAFYELRAALDKGILKESVLNVQGVRVIPAR